MKRIKDSRKREMEREGYERQMKERRNRERQTEGEEQCYRVRDCDRDQAHFCL